MKLLISKISYGLLAILGIYIFTRYIIIRLLPLLDRWLVSLIYSVIVLLILIILIDTITNHNNFTQREKEKICHDLDNNIEKVFKKFGLYITKNYIVCIGSKWNIFKLFVVPIKDIDAINTHDDRRFFYERKQKSTEHEFWEFIKASWKTKLMYGDNEVCVFNIICDKKVYVVTTSMLNRRKSKQIDEMADYICAQHDNIDYLR